MRFFQFQTAVAFAALAWTGSIYCSPTAPDLPEGWERQLPAHPRLVLNDLRLAGLKERIAKDPFLQEWVASLRHDAEEALALPPSEHRLEGRRMLATSRESLRRLLLWSFLYRLEGDPRFLAAAVKELDAVGAFPDWNPSHFLDTAEMAAGVALAFDWLHADLDATQKSRIVTALRTKAIAPFFDLAPKLAEMSHNWNSVCHGGIILASLAIATEAPDKARRALHAAIPAFAAVESTYAPDGVFTEGPSYWDYGTSYLCLTADALETTWGTTCGLDGIPGVRQSALFMEALTSPNGRTFNFADCYDIPRPLNFATAWLGARTADAFLLNRYAARARRTVSVGEKSHETHRFMPLAVLFAALAPAQEENAAAPPLAMAGRGPVPVAALRTSWSDPAAAYLAIKGGSSGFSHGHMDVGSFVYDWNGIRWFLDIEREGYETLESKGFSNLFDTSQESRRWEIFRNGSESHNILRFEQCRQRTKGVAREISLASEPHPKATLDLTPVYTEHAKSVTRSATLSPEGRALIEDSWVLHPGREDSEVAWQFVTAAEVEKHPWGVRLKSGTSSVEVRVLAPQDFRVVVSTADSLLHSHDAPLPGVSRIQFLARGSKTFLVSITPEGADQPLH